MEIINFGAIPVRSWEKLEAEASSKRMAVAALLFEYHLRAQAATNAGLGPSA